MIKILYRLFFTLLPLIFSLPMLAEGYQQGAINLLVCGDKADEGLQVQAKQVEKWSEKHEFPVSITYIPWEGCQEFVLLQATSDKHYDLAYVGTRTIPILKRRGIIQPLSIHVINNHYYAEAVLDSVQIEGAVWGYPRAFSSKAFFWNKSVFEEAGLDPDKPPKNWEELVAFCQQIHEKTGKSGIVQIGGLTDVTYHQFLNFYFNTKALKNHNFGQKLFTDEAVYSVLNIYFELKKCNGLTYELSRGEARDYFIAGKTAMMIDGPWMPAILEKENVDYGASEIPSEDGSLSHSLLIIDALVLLTHSPHAKEAQNLAIFLTNSVNQDAYERASNLLPLKSQYSGHENTQLFIDIIKTGYAEPKFVDYWRVQASVIDAVRQSLQTERLSPRLSERIVKSEKPAIYLPP